MWSHLTHNKPEVRSGKYKHKWEHNSHSSQTLVRRGVLHHGTGERALGWGQRSLSVALDQRPSPVSPVESPGFMSVACPTRHRLSIQNLLVK